jgi:phospholipid transport system transporter-binding protein
MSPLPALDGELNFSTVPACLQRAGELGAGGVIDLSAVSRVDSAGLSLLLELQRRQAATGGKLRIVGANEQVLTLARFFGLQEILNFEREAA